MCFFLFIQTIIYDKLFSLLSFYSHHIIVLHTGIDYPAIIKVLSVCLAKVALVVISIVIHLCDTSIAISILDGYWFTKKFA